MQPYLVDSLKGPDLANISDDGCRASSGRAVSEQVANTLTDLMVAAEQVTQQKGAIAGVQIASKTGTAEHGTDPRNTRRTPGTSPSRRHRPPRLRSPCWSRTAVTGSRPPAARSPRPSGAPPSQPHCGRVVSSDVTPKASASEDASASMRRREDRTSEREARQ